MLKNENGSRKMCTLHALLFPDEDLLRTKKMKFILRKQKIVKNRNNIKLWEAEECKAIEDRQCLNRCILAFKL